MANLSNINNKFLVTTGGNVGIGVTGPVAPLDVFGAAVQNGSTPGIKLSSSNTQQTVFAIGNTGTRQYELAVGGTTSSVPGAFYIYDNNASDFRITLATSGNVGIGTNSPNSILHVGSTGTNAYSATITKGSNMKGIINTISNNADDMVGIYFATGSTTEGTHWSGITGSRSDNASHWGTQLNFYTHNNDVANLNDATQKMVIKGDGNVGIGETSPTRQLHLKRTSGDVRGIMVETTVATSYAEVQVKAASEFRIGTGGSSTTPNGQFYVYDATAGAHRFDIAANGNVGIGITSGIDANLRVDANSATLTQEILKVKGGGSGGAYGFLVEANNGDDLFKVNTLSYDSYFPNGNVAIGISFATAKLQIHNTNAGAAAVAAYLVNASTSLNTETRLAFAAHTNDDIATNRYSYISTINTSGSNGQDMIFATNATGAGGSERMRITNAGFVTIKNNAGVNNASLTFSNSDTGIGIDQSIGYLNFYSNDVSTSSLGGVGGIAVKAEEAFNTSFTPTYMSFYTHERTNNDGTTLGNVIERMRITSSGYIEQGIVGTTGNAYYYFNTSTSGDSGLIFRDNTSTNSGYVTYNHFENAMKFGVNGSERMRIDSSGNVAIGATSSSSKLKVEGPNTSSNPLVDLVASGTGSFQRGVRLLNGGMNAGDEIMYSVGRSDNTRNMGQMYFHYVGNGSTSNRISMGLHGVDDVFNIAGTGNVGIGTTSPSDKLYVDAGTGSIYAGNFVYGGTDGTKGCLRLRTVASTGPSFIDFFYDGFSTNPLSPVGAIVTTGTSTSYASFSDYRMKQNVNDLTNVLDKVVNLKPKTFNYKNVPDIEVQGFLAHELQEVIPQAVHGEKDEVHPDGNPKYQLVDHSHMIPLLTAAIKELKADNDSLRARIETLENK